MPTSNGVTASRESTLAKVEQPPCKCAPCTAHRDDDETAAALATVTNSDACSRGDAAGCAAIIKDKFLFTFLDLQKRTESGSDYFFEFEKQGIHLIPPHFYSPIPVHRDIPRSAFDLSNALIDGRDYLSGTTLPGIDFRISSQLMVLRQCLELRDELARFPLNNDGTDKYYYQNPGQNPLDAAILYCMVRTWKPKRIVEIGCGYSSVLITSAIAVNREEGVESKFTSIDPFPVHGFQQSIRSRMGGQKNIEFMEKYVQDVPPEWFVENLSAGDLLFIDSSHVLKLGSDVEHEFLRVLPTIPAGVIVHVHDIFLPFQYPEDWIVNHRFWNEQYLLQALMTTSKSWSVLYASTFMRRLAHEETSKLLPFDVPGLPGSFWMVRQPDTSAGRQGTAAVAGFSPPYFPFSFSPSTMTVNQQSKGKEADIFWGSASAKIERWTTAQHLTPASPDHVVMDFHLHKGVNGPILSTGKPIPNKSGREYRVTRFSWHIDYSGLGMPGRVESAESDVCLVRARQGVHCDLSSGTETFCVHEHAISGHTHSTDNVIPLGGFRLRNGDTLWINGVSNIYPKVEQPEMEKRILESKGNLLSLIARVELVAASAVPVPAVTSVRSPYRDRSFVVTPGSVNMPHTSFRNNMERPVTVTAIGTFLSSLTHFLSARLNLEILVDGEIVYKQPLPSHVSRVDSQSSTHLIPVNVVLQTGQVITARVTLVATWSHVYDAALFIISDAVDQHDDRGGLVRAYEFSLFDPLLDINNDNVPDYIDVDDRGSVFIELSRGDQGECHDTQFERAWLPVPVREAMRDRQSVKLHTTPAGQRPSYPHVFVTIESQDKQICVQLLRLSEVDIDLALCDTPSSSSSTSSSETHHVWGDFNGDGKLDRVHRLNSGAVQVRFGDGRKLGSAKHWFTAQIADKMFARSEDGVVPSNVVVEVLNPHSAAVYNWGGDDQQRWDERESSH